MADMFRYLMKFVGTYKVLAEFDPETGDFPRGEDGDIDPSFEDLYIPCPKGQIKHTYVPGVLCFYAPSYRKIKGLIDKIYTENPKIVLDIDDLGEEALINFRESDLKILEKYFRPKKLKAKISPFDKRNLPEKPVEEKPKRTRKPRAKKEA